MFSNASNADDIASNDKIVNSQSECDRNCHSLLWVLTSHFHGMTEENKTKSCITLHGLETKIWTWECYPLDHNVLPYKKSSLLLCYYYCSWLSKRNFSDMNKSDIKSDIALFLYKMLWLSTCLDGCSKTMQHMLLQHI